MSGRVIFLLVAAVFVATGLATSIWISLGQFDDPFCYGTVQLWNALDPGALYFSDAVEFFSLSKVECFHHPGLTMDLIAGAFIRTAWLLSAPLHDYHLFVARHRFFFFGLASFLSTICFLACCQPLARLVRRFGIPGLGEVVGALFLCSVPVLLFINRFSDEPYYLLFGLWALELSLRAMESANPRRLWFLSGLAMALSLLAKPLMLPAFVLTGAWTLVKSNQRLSWLLSTAAGALIAAVPLLLKLPVRQWIDLMIMEAHNRERTVAPLQFLARTDQAPLVPHHIVLIVAGAAGLIVLLAMGEKRQRQLAGGLAVLAVALFALTARRPDWHYFFSWYWCALTLAAAGAMLLARRTRRAPAATFVVLVVLLDVWGYRGLLSTYKQYHDRWAKRWPIAQRDPNSLPAVWERRVGDTNLTEIFPVRSERLQRALNSLREADRRADR